MERGIQNPALGYFGFAGEPDQNGEVLEAIGRGPVCSVSPILPIFFPLPPKTAHPKKK